MIGQSTERAPHASVVLPHFAFSSISFLAVAVLLTLADTAMFGHYFQGKILALTHMGTLGWITMVIFGALYQLIPVVLEVPLYSEKLAKVNFVVFAVGILGMVPAFWNNSFGWALLGPSILLLLAFVLFSFNIAVTALQTKKWTVEAFLVISSIFWFLFTGIVGFLLSLNFTYPFLKVSHLEYLKAHAHMGIGGWFLMLIMGVGSVLIPMFFLSHKMNKKKLWLALLATNAGIALFSIDHMFLFLGWDALSLFIVATGVGGFLSYIYESFKKRARKKLDIGLKHTVVSLLMMLIPVALAVIVHFTFGMNTQLLFRLGILYGASILLGVITSLILGQFYKTLPFIIWLWRYQAYVGKYRTPLPKNLYSEKLLTWQYWSYNAAVALLFVGLAFGSEWSLRIGGVGLIIAAVIFNINVLKMFLHKRKLTEL